MSDRAQRFAGKVAMVTGGGGDIGRAIAVRLAEEGAAVVIANRDEANADETVRRIVAGGGKAVASLGDIGVPADVERTVAAAHSAFGDVDSMLDFVELLAMETGLPVGIKSAVGDEQFFVDLAGSMASTDRGIDWITIDGGEGGTGAGPLAFTDHVSLPFKIGFSHVYRAFAEQGLTDDVVFIGSGRLGLPHTALLAFALGCDGINVGREAMLAIGCIQAQRCHTGRCPTGVTSHARSRTRGLDPTDKSVRVANYLMQLRHEILQLGRACGVQHPAMVSPDQIEILDDTFGSRSGRDVFGYEPGWGVASTGGPAGPALTTSTAGSTRED